MSMSAISDILGDLETGMASCNSQASAYHSQHRPPRIRDNRQSRSRSGTPTRNYESSDERMNRASYEGSSQDQNGYGEDRHRRQRPSSHKRDRQRSSSVRRDQQSSSQHRRTNDQYHKERQRAPVREWADHRYNSPETHGTELEYKEPRRISISDSSCSDELFVEDVLDKRGKICDHELQKMSGKKGRSQRNDGKLEENQERDVSSGTHRGRPPIGKSKNSAIKYESNGKNPENQRRKTYNDQDSNKKSATSEANTNTKKKSQPSREHETAAGPKGEQWLGLPPSSPAPKQEIEIIHRDVSEKESSMLSCLESRRAKRIAILALIYCVIASAVCGWLVSQFVRIPGLRDEINDLKAQVNRLATEVDELTSENNRLEGEVDRLDVINDNLEETVASISRENEQAKELVTQLNQSVLDFKEQNELLEGENDRLNQYTNTLNITVTNLSRELGDVRETEAELLIAVEGYIAVQETLEEELITLTSHANNLNITVDELSEAVSFFEEENKQFQELNEDLGQIVSFLADEAESVEETYAALASHLADTILRKQVLTEEALKNRMKSELAGWECGFRTAFSGQDFMKDENVPIGYSSYDTVMSYISGRFLGNLCLPRGNLETFLVDEVILAGQSIWEISSKDLSAGINIYTLNALDHYFPDEGEEGLNSTSWDEVDYDCSKLPFEQRYFYGAS